MPVIPITPRHLNDAESAVLGKILSVDLPWAGALRAQVETCQVVSQWASDSVSVDIEPTTATVPATGVGDGVLHVVGAVRALPGAEMPFEGEILIWVGNGFLAGIEYAWYGEEMPTALPSPERIEIEIE
ncbi:hypothetical protein ABT160_31135 [Streptomyces sp. NPDC001941]|uniref:hypothetical protein n=1 Tax=Streptomyces sp. NPDC001941 TaxID=3154659 RepID=UPI0033210FE7